MKRLLAPIATSLFGFCVATGTASAQGLPLDIPSLMKELPKQCEEPSRILAEARFSKWQKKAIDISRPLSEADKQAIYAVMKDQCVSVQLVILLRTLKSTISASEWIKLGGEVQLRELLVRIERTM